MGLRQENCDSCSRYVQPCSLRTYIHMLRPSCALPQHPYNPQVLQPLPSPPPPPPPFPPAGPWPWAQCRPCGRASPSPRSSPWPATWLTYWRGSRCCRWALWFGVMLRVGWRLVGQSRSQSAGRISCLSTQAHNRTSRPQPTPTPHPPATPRRTGTSTARRPCSGFLASSSRPPLPPRRCRTTRASTGCPSTRCVLACGCGRA